MKDAYWFKHDNNARHDHKIISLRAKYGAAGYGVYWMLIETLRETADYRFPVKHFGALALDFAFPDIADFIADCVNEFDLLSTDNEFVWSDSLVSRMEKHEKIKEKRAEYGRKGGMAKQNLSKPEAKAKQNLSKSQAKPKQKPSKPQAEREERERERERDIDKKEIKDITLRAEDGTSLVKIVMDAMESKYGKFSNYPMESKKAQHIVERSKVLYPDRIEAFLNAILGCYWKQTQNGKTLKGKPFTPATLDTEWIWAENFEAFRRKQTAGSSAVKDAIF